MSKYIEIGCNYEAPQEWWESGGSDLFEKYWTQYQTRWDMIGSEDILLTQEEFSLFLKEAAKIEGWIDEEAEDCPVTITDA